MTVKLPNLQNMKMKKTLSLLKVTFVILAKTVVIYFKTFVGYTWLIIVGVLASLQHILNQINVFRAIFIVRFDGIEFLFC